jgi:histidine triad (HIT) family protein
MAERAPVSRPPNKRLERTGRSRPLSRQPLDRCRVATDTENIMGDKQCIFCAVIERAAGAFIVYENSHAVVFLDKHPINVGHVLVVPKRHVEAFYELDEESFVGLMLVVKRMASVIGAVYQAKKVGMLAAGFDVAHAHLHVLPMHDYHDITSKTILEGKRANPTEGELQQAAGEIKRGLNIQGGGAI